ncbi:hypothetical protein ACI3PL_20315, partial [Lacticaseibacillus paracasei]
EFWRSERIGGDSDIGAVRRLGTKLDMRRIGFVLIVERGIIAFGVYVNEIRPVGANQFELLCLDRFAADIRKFFVAIEKNEKLD